MDTIWELFDVGLTAILKGLLQGIPFTNHKLVLTETTAWDKTASITEIEAAELDTGNGYTAGGLSILSSLTANPLFDTPQDRAESGVIDLSTRITASGGSLSFRGIVWVGTFEAVDTPLFFIKLPALATVTDGNSYPLQWVVNAGGPGTNLVTP